MKNHLKLIIISACILIAAAAITIILLMIFHKPATMAPTEEQQKSLSDQAQQTSLKGFQAADSGDANKAIEYYKQAYELYKQAGDELGMQNAQMYIAMGQKDLEVPTSNVPSDGPLPENK